MFDRHFLVGEGRRGVMTGDDRVGNVEEEDVAPWAPKRSEKVSESVARRILADITDSAIAPGGQLPSEGEMLRRFAVGRGSLREALRILEVYGVIAVRPGPGGGPVVRSVGSSDFARAATFYFQLGGARFQEVIEARREMEQMMARLAAQVETPEVARRH
jgi:GntR family transcriptional repressor for pyruvate dehydrogenase complex